MKIIPPLKLTSLLVVSLGSVSLPVAADTILVDAPRGSVIKLAEKGEPACGMVSWSNIRQAGSVTIDGHLINMQEAKLPLNQQQWQQLLSKIAGNKDEITIAHAWEKGPAGLAAALRVAYDIRSHGGTAWVLNGAIGDLKPEANCNGSYAFKGKPQEIYMSELQFFSEMRKGRFLDARGDGAKHPPSYTWVMGSPQKAKAVDIASFMDKGKLDKDSYSCDVFNDVTVAGCDSVHKTFLAVEAAKYANCSSQPKIMPYWGLAGASRDSHVAKKVWGDDFSLNEKRSGEIAK